MTQAATRRALLAAALALPIVWLLSGKSPYTTMSLIDVSGGR